MYFINLNRYWDRGIGRLFLFIPLACTIYYGVKYDKNLSISAEVCFYGIQVSRDAEGGVPYKYSHVT